MACNNINYSHVICNSCASQSECRKLQPNLLQKVYDNNNNCLFAKYKKRTYCRDCIHLNQPGRDFLRKDLCDKGGYNHDCNCPHFEPIPIKTHIHRISSSLMGCITIVCIIFIIAYYIFT